MFWRFENTVPGNLTFRETVHMKLLLIWFTAKLFLESNNILFLEFKTFSDGLKENVNTALQPRVPIVSTLCQFVCLECRTFPQSGPDPAQIGFEAISVPTRSICSKLLSISFHETTTRGLRKEGKKEKTKHRRRRKINQAQTAPDWGCRSLTDRDGDVHTLKKAHFDSRVTFLSISL